MAQRTSRARRRARHQVSDEVRRRWPEWTQSWAEQWVVGPLVLGVLVGIGFAAVAAAQTSVTDWWIAGVVSVMLAAIGLALVRHLSRVTPYWRRRVAWTVIGTASGTFGFAIARRGIGPVGPPGQLASALTLTLTCLLVLAVVLWRRYGQPPRVHHDTTVEVVTADDPDNDGFQAICRCGWRGTHQIYFHRADAEQRAEFDAAAHLRSVRKPAD